MTARLGSATLCSQQSTIPALHFKPQFSAVPSLATEQLNTFSFGDLRFCIKAICEIHFTQFKKKEQNKLSMYICDCPEEEAQFPVCLQTVRYESRCAAVLTWRHVSWSWTLGCRGASRGKLAPSQREESPAPESDSRNQRGQEGKQNNNAVVSGVFQIAQIHTVNPSHTMWLTGTCLWWGVWACRWIYEALTPC